MKFLGQILLMAALAGNSCGHAMDQTNQVTVEAEIFSGRPNPSWELKDGEASEFRRRLAALKPADSAGPAFDGLGYRGLTVRISGSEPQTIRVYRGAAEHHKRRWLDEGRSLEKWLVASGKGKIDTGLFLAITQESDK